MNITNRKIKEIAEKLWESDYDRIDLDEQCYNTIKQLMPEESELQLWDITLEVVKKVKRDIKKRIEECLEKGVPPSFEFCEYEDTKLISYSLVGREPIHIKALRKQKREILDVIEKMRWREFEYLCKYILQTTLRTKNVYVTRETKEGGIDVYALIDLGDFIPGIMFKNAFLQIIGQAKKWKNIVGEETINALRTQYQDFRNRVGKAFEVLPNWFTEMNESSIGIVATISSFSSGAIESAKRENMTIIYWNMTKFSSYLLIHQTQKIG